MKQNYIFGFFCHTIGSIIFCILRISN